MPKNVKKCQFIALSVYVLNVYVHVLEGNRRFGLGVHNVYVDVYVDVWKWGATAQDNYHFMALEVHGNGAILLAVNFTDG